MSGWYNLGVGYQVLAWVNLGLALLFTGLAGKRVAWPVLRRHLGWDPPAKGEAAKLVLGFCLVLVVPWWLGILWFWNGIAWLSVQPDGTWNLRNTYTWTIESIASQAERRLFLDDVVQGYTDYSVEGIPRTSQGTGIRGRLETRTGVVVPLVVEEYQDPKYATGTTFFARLGYGRESGEISSGTLVFPWHAYSASGPIFPEMR